MGAKISIIMPAYNAGKYISESIESILAQTYSNWELVIVDDESSDNTAEVVKRHQQEDGRIKYFWQKNGKQGKTRNKAIRESEGSYLAFMDADDVWLPDKLQRQVRLLEETGSDIVFGYAYLIDDGKKTTRQTGTGRGFYKGNDAVAFFLYQYALVMSTVLARRSAIEKVGCFVEDLKIQYCEDWHIWLKLAFEGFSFYTDSSVVSYYRIHETSAAKIEKEDKIKFFFALLDLHYRYPDHQALREEVARRAYLLVYHSSTLSEVLVSEISRFLKASGYARFWHFLYTPLYRLNRSVFRKFFLFSNRRAVELHTQTI